MEGHTYLPSFQSIGRSEYHLKAAQKAGGLTQERSLFRVFVTAAAFNRHRLMQAQGLLLTRRYGLGLGVKLSDDTDGQRGQGS